MSRLQRRLESLTRASVSQRRNRSKVAESNRADRCNRSKELTRNSSDRRHQPRPDCFEQVLLVTRVRGHRAIQAQELGTVLRDYRRGDAPDIALPIAERRAEAVLEVFLAS